MAALAAVGALSGADARAQERAPGRLSRTAIEALPDAVRGALERAEQAVRARPEDPAVTGHLGKLLHAYGQHRLAAEVYERAAHLDPGAVTWSYLAGVAHAEAGTTGEAIAAFRRTLDKDPEHLPARIRLAAALLDDGDLAASRAAYEVLVRSVPQMALAHYGLGRVLAASGDEAAALPHYERAVLLAPEFGRAHYALALLYRDQGLNDRATHHLRAYQSYGSRQPSLSEPVLDEIRSMTGTARALLAQGTQLAAAGQIEEAIAVHLQAVEADPGASQAHVNLISLYGRTGQVEKAEQHYRSAVRLESHVAEAHYNYGVLQAAAGRYVEAEDAFRRALDTDPFHPRAHKNLGALLARRHEYDEALRHYERALASDPQHESAQFGLAEVLVVLKRPRQAIPYLEKLIRRESPERPRYRYALAIAYLAAGDTSTGIQHAEDALREATAAGHRELAARIARELRKMKAASR